jgi:hypothetical protein
MCVAMLMGVICSAHSHSRRGRRIAANIARLPELPSKYLIKKGAGLAQRFALIVGKIGQRSPRWVLRKIAGPSALPSIASRERGRHYANSTPYNTTQRRGNNAGGNAQRYPSLGHTSVRWPTQRNDVENCSVPFRQLL